MSTLCGMHAAHELALNTAEKRLNHHSEELAKLNDCVVRLTVLQERTQEHHESNEDRIVALEMLPAQRWNKVISTIITAVVSALIGALLVSYRHGVLGG